MPTQPLTFKKGNTSENHEEKNCAKSYETVIFRDSFANTFSRMMFVFHGKLTYNEMLEET